MVPDITDKQKGEVYRFLDELQKSGITNMFGAAVDIQAEFYVTRQQARRLLAAWMSDKKEAYCG
tara:strand:+ start:326 stop:517 length:192 start_codon:yes stop_codon:yes gene_type:complete